eukprot:Hpha_TRINITY_DN30537_c0_g1::TRINITY_DN30537_c0_g1_i1::g.193571::m.193571
MGRAKRGDSSGVSQCDETQSEHVEAEGDERPAASFTPTLADAVPPRGVSPEQTAVDCCLSSGATVAASGENAMLASLSSGEAAAALGLASSPALPSAAILWYILPRHITQHIIFTRGNKVQK